MDPSLLLLLRLRSWAWIRRWGRNVRTLKGLLLAVVGGLFFLPLLTAFVFAPRIQTEAQIELIRRFGALGLMAFCVLNVLLSTGERAVYYSPAEVSFLFSGPYRPRQLLLYKIVAGFGAGLLSTPFMTPAFAHHAHRFVSAFVAVFLALQFLSMFTIAVGLIVSTIGAHAFSIGRKLVLLGVAAVGAAVLYPLAQESTSRRPDELLAQALGSPVLRVALLPFEPFVRAFSARELWPELALWSTVCLGVDLLLLGAILGLNAHFLEASASASARMYARIRRARRGEAWHSDTTRVLFRLPALPWLGGIGPNLWRQLTTASRQLPKLFGLVVLFVVPTTTVVVVTGGLTDRPSEAGPSLAVIIGLALFAPAMIGFDFRPDIGRMEDLKTLPIAPRRLVLGQLLAPVAILTALEWVAVAVLASYTHPSPGFLWGVVVMIPPANLLLVEIENVYFLWFPFRMTGINALDFQAMGRQLLLTAAKGATIGTAAALAAAGGALAYYLSRQSLTAALVAAWLILASCALALVPLVATAFDQFDVAQIPPD